MENLDWLVVVELWETETAAFWKRPGVDPTTIDTEVFLLPAAAFYEKEGSITNSGRWSQWRYQALPPPGQAKPDLEIINKLAQKLIQLYTPEAGSLLADPVANLHWGFYPGTDAQGETGTSPTGYETGGVADAHKVAWELNGYWCPSGPPAKAGHRVNGFWGTALYSTLQYDGQTSSGNWLYCSHYVDPGDGGNRQENRDCIDHHPQKIGLFSGWSYCWPLNRRIIYNGASVYQTGHLPAAEVGQPLAPSKWVVAWDAGGTAYRAGGDVPDGFTPPGGTKPRYPFIMLPEGHGKLFGPGRADGPFPEHYEPWETVLPSNPLGTLVGKPPVSPTAFAHARPERYEQPGYGNAEFPIVGTTYRLTEHWQAGQMTRNLPWQCQLQPEPFVELSEQLAGILGIGNGDMVEVKTQRTELYNTRMLAKACVTKRFKPYTVAGRTVHHIGAIWHFGYTGCCTGASANLLTAHIGDANTGIPESKAFICNIRLASSPGDTGWLT
jgi:formate dehydrogenase major subunit